MSLRRLRSAWDFFLEIEVAARLRGIAPVRFDEPDIVIEDEEGRCLGIACKRPTIAGFRDRVRHGVQQIGQSPWTRGVVIVGLQISDSPLVHAPTVEHGFADCDASLAEERTVLSAAALDVIGKESSRFSHADVLGVVLLARFVVIVRAGNGFSAFMPRFRCAVIPNPGVAEAPVELEALCLLLARGEHR